MLVKSKFTKQKFILLLTLVFPTSVSIKREQNSKSLFSFHHVDKDKSKTHIQLFMSLFSKYKITHLISALLCSKTGLETTKMGILCLVKFAQLPTELLTC